MKTLFQNTECIILYDDYSYQPNRSDATRITAWLGFDTLAHAYEVWVYKPATKRFYAYKNKGGLLNEGIHRMSEFGIKVKLSAVSLSNTEEKELSFVTPKDQFHFELKF